MMNALSIWLIGGTSEGRELAEWLSRQKMPAYVSVATSYGASLVPSSPFLTVVARRMDAQAMAEFIDQHQITCVVDTSHPYAAVVTANISQVCKEKKLLYIRVTRPGSTHRDCISVTSAEEAVEVLSMREGHVFLTTGSKNLDIFAQIPRFEERVYARILPVRNSLGRALDLGYPPSHIICMQGPFSVALNEAMFRECQAAYVVTKDSGQRGGFAEKAAAARASGAVLVVIERQCEQPGESLGEAKRQLLRLAGKE